MNKKSLLAAVSGLSALALVVTCGPALAFGHHGHHGKDMEYGMLAHAAGVSHETIHSTFKNDAQLKTDFENLKAAKKAMDACIIAGSCNNGEIASYANAQSTLTQQKLNDWHKIFAEAPNKGAATTLKGKLDALKLQRHQLMQEAFGSAKGATSTVTGPVSPQ